FDGVAYRLSTPTSKQVLLLSLRWGSCWAQLQSFNVTAGFDVSLSIDLSTVPKDAAGQAALVSSLAMLKRNCLSAPFELAFQAQSQGSASPLMAVHYRSADEAIYVQAQPDRVTVIFSTVFAEETDAVIGRVFLQEFVDARRQPGIQNAPQVLYSAREPPLELSGVKGLRDSDTVGYVTFVLFPRHFSTPALQHETISRIQLFRDYLHYHIKCSKSYLHSRYMIMLAGAFDTCRLRVRVTEFLKVLNRAKPELPDSQKEKKLASGKTFTRK
ncbi:MAG: hypothetical protein SGCHY_005361, partial [Lobulomycetales sp.]